MRPKGSQQTLEWRRQRAIELLQIGKSPAEVAEFLGVGRNTVYRWQRRFRREGTQGIEAKPIPGRPPRLTPEQCERLLQHLAESPRAHGFSSDHWSQARVASLIRMKFDVQFCAFHVGRILAALGYHVHKAAQQASGTNGLYR